MRRQQLHQQADVAPSRQQQQQQQQPALVNWCGNHCVYLPAMFGWFFFSYLFRGNYLVLQRFVYGRHHDLFPCPLLLKSLQFGFQWLASYILCHIFPLSSGVHRIQQMSWRVWAHLSLPCGLVISGAVGLPYLSVTRMSLTFFSMMKASTPIFVLGWAYLFGIERITSTLLGVVLIIALGEFLTAQGETAGFSFNPSGVFSFLVVSNLSGAQWTLVQLKLQRLEPKLQTPLTAMLLLSPSMFGSMLVLTIVWEQPWRTLAAYPAGELFIIAGLGLYGAVLVMGMFLCEFYLIMYSSAIILMIGGVCQNLLFKLVIVVFIGTDLIEKIGSFIVFLGVVVYKITFRSNYGSEGGDDDVDDGGGNDNSLASRSDDIVHLLNASNNHVDDESIGLAMNGLEVKPNGFNGGGTTVELRQNPVSPQQSTRGLMSMEVECDETL